MSFLKPFLLLFSYTLLSLFCTLCVAQTPVMVGHFSQGDLTGWQEKSFAAMTHYEIETVHHISAQQQVLKAHSESSASGLGKESTIDLKKTPFINWSWRIDTSLKDLNETSKDGDDYAARLYVVKDGGWRVWKTRALNYVWSSNQLAGSHWNNAFVGDKAKMLAIRGQEHPIKKWVREKRNVYEDLITLFGDQGSDEANLKAYRYLDAVALMTDTDNSAGSATAFYGDIYFTEH